MSSSCVICLEDEGETLNVTNPCDSCSSVAFCEKCWDAYVTRGYRTCPQCKKILVLAPPPPPLHPPPASPPHPPPASPPASFVDRYSKTRRLKDILMLHTFSSWLVLLISLALGNGMLLTRLSLGAIGSGTTYMLRSLHIPPRIIGAIEGYCNAIVFVFTIVFWLLMIANVALYDRCIEYVVFTIESFLLFWLFVYGMIHWTDDVARVVPEDGRGSQSSPRPIRQDV